MAPPIAPPVCSAVAIKHSQKQLGTITLPRIVMKNRASFMSPPSKQWYSKIDDIKTLKSLQKVDSRSFKQSLSVEQTSDRLMRANSTVDNTPVRMKSLI